MSFGFMSTLGASAAQLRTEVENAVLPRIPQAVCLLAPGNDLTASRTVDEAAVEFRRLLTAMCRRWPKASFFLFSTAFIMYDSGSVNASAA